MDWSALGGVARIRPYSVRNRDAVRAFSCVTPGQNFTRDVQRIIRQVPDRVAGDLDDEIWIGVAEVPEVGIVGVVVYQAQLIGSAPIDEIWPFIVALGVDRDYRRRGIGTLLKTAAMLDMSDRGMPDGFVGESKEHRNDAVEHLPV